MRPGKRRKAFARRVGHFFGAARRTAAEAYHADRQRKQIPDPMVHLSEQEFLPLLPTLTLCDVSGNFRRSNYVAVTIPDRRNRHGNVDEAAVLALPNRFVMLDSFSAPDAVQHHGFFVVPIRRNEDCDGPANGFLRGIAEESMRATIPAGDHAVEVFGQDRVIGGFNDRGVVQRGAIGRQTIAANSSVRRLGQVSATFDAGVAVLAREPETQKWA